MAALAQILADRFVGHHVNLLRLAEGERETIFRMLGQLQTELLGKMDRQIPLPGFGTFNQRKVQALFTLTDRLIHQKYGRIAREHQSTLIDLAELESERTRSLVKAAVGVPLLSVGVPLTTLKALATDDLVEGRPAKEWWSQQGDNLRGRFQQTIRQGVFAGETLDELKRRVRGTQAKQFQDGIMSMTGRQAEALIRTSVQSVANAARYETFKANGDVLGGMQALVTLDARTSELCMGRSGYAWDLDGNPLTPDTTIPFPGPPPWHFNCRTVLVPVLKSWEQLLKEAKGNEDLGKTLDRVEAKLGRGTQASMDGQVAADLTYEAWLKTKEESFQIEVLGRARWELWQAGQISLADLVDLRGRPLTIEQLKAIAKAEPVPPEPPTAPPTTPDPTVPPADQWVPSGPGKEWHLASFSSAPEMIKQAMAVLPGLHKLELIPEHATSHYMRRDNAIYLARNYTTTDGQAQAVWRHEYGHHLDHQLGEQQSSAGSLMMRSAFPDWVATRKSDARALLRKGKADEAYRQGEDLVREYQRRLTEDGRESARSWVQQQLQRVGLDLADVIQLLKEAGSTGPSELDALRIQSMLAVGAVSPMFDAVFTRSTITAQGLVLTDLLGAVTKNKIGYGHSLAYYRQRPDGQGAEAVANIIALLGHPNPAWGTIARALVPRLTESVEKELRRVGRPA